METTLTVTSTLLARDRAKAADILLELKYQFSRKTSSVEIK